jgi:hypothetical protein
MGSLGQGNMDVQLVTVFNLSKYKVWKKTGNLCYFRVAKGPHEQTTVNLLHPLDLSHLAWQKLFFSYGWESTFDPISFFS